MVSAKENSLMRRMHAVIKKFGVIESLELQNECGRMSISTYNKLKRAFLKTFDEHIGFEKQGDNHLFYDRKPENPELFKLINQVIKSDTIQYCGSEKLTSPTIDKSQQTLN